MTIRRAHKKSVLVLKIQVLENEEQVECEICVLGKKCGCPEEQCMLNKRERERVGFFYVCEKVEHLRRTHSHTVYFK